jgi:hypothetical protein
MTYNVESSSAELSTRRCLAMDIRKIKVNAGVARKKVVEHTFIFVAAQIKIGLEGTGGNENSAVFF